MIEPRIYRAAFLPALLAVVLAMFSLESRPRPLPQGLAADVLFDGGAGGASSRAGSPTARRTAARARPATRATAELVAASFARSGFAGR